MLLIENIILENPPLQNYPWPLVNSFEKIDEEMLDFINSSRQQKETILSNISHDIEAHGALLNNYLGVIYSYLYGYPDSPCYLSSNIDLELLIQEAKLILEYDFIIKWLQLSEEFFIDKKQDVVNELKKLTASNPGTSHELFDFIELRATKEMILEFLRLEVLRNEVVDDEVALIVCGLQGNMKKAMVSNLWDECGNGSLTKFHTYWLRQLIDSSLNWNDFLIYRDGQQPWFSKISSNSFNSVLFRPQYKFRAYGHFLITESWVGSHFTKIINGLERVGLANNDVTIYFSAHTKIDPHHTKEIINSLEYQNPTLTATETKEVLIGANQAIKANLQQYDRVLSYLKSLN
jgi:hypothetical protein